MFPAPLTPGLASCTQPGPQVVKDSLALHRIASSLRRRRFDGGALRLDNTRLFFKLDEEGNPHDYGVYEQAGVGRAGRARGLRMPGPGIGMPSACRHLDVPRVSKLLPHEGWDPRVATLTVTPCHATGRQPVRARLPCGQTL